MTLGLGTRQTITAQAHTAIQRHEVTRCAADAIQAAGGLLTDVRQFSNVALMLHCEIPAAGLEPVGRVLDKAGIRLDEPSKAAIQDASALPRESVVEFVLHLRFYNEEPDLRIPTPAVPG